MSKVYEDYLQAKRDYQSAEKWTTMEKRGGGRMSSDSFKISVAHSAIKLTRCGQYQASGTNYWESEKPLNTAMLEWIVKNIDLVQEGALAILKEKELKSLQACQEFVKQIQADIDAAVKEVPNV